MEEGDGMGWDTLGFGEGFGKRWDGDGGIYGGAVGSGEWVWRRAMGWARWNAVEVGKLVGRDLDGMGLVEDGGCSGLGCNGNLCWRWEFHFVDYLEDAVCALAQLLILLPILSCLADD